MLDYVGEKYGRDKVAQCVIYGTIKTKQALKDSARIMGYDFSVGDKITKALPPAQTGGKDIPLHDIFDPSAETIRGSTRIPRTVRSPTRTRNASRTRRWASKV